MVETTQNQADNPAQTLIPQPIQDKMNACVSNADDLLRSAKRVFEDERLPNIAYHLVVLALEEIGKAELVGMLHIAGTHSDPLNWAEKQEDHVRKLFWALWGPSFGKEVITREQIESFQHLAREIHSTRLRGLYVEALREETILPKDAVTEEMAKNLLSLATARLGMAKSSGLRVLDEEGRKTLAWFLQATKDSEKRNLMFGKKSMEKLTELEDTRAWMEWMRHEFEKADLDARSLLESELKRTQPPDDEARKEKWRLKIRLHTNSHSIRPKPLADWNKSVTWIKLFPVNNKKNQLLVEFVLSKNIPIHGVWWAGWGVARKFVVSMNIGCFGFFWWYVPEQISRFYEGLKDLEAGADVVVERSPILKLDWKREALSERDLNSVALCFSMIPGPGDEDKHEPFGLYLTGLAFLSRTDVHMQFEANAYEVFYKTLKSAFRSYGDWDGVSPFAQVFHAVMKDWIPDEAGRQRFIDLGEQFEKKPVAISEAITLSEAGGIKILCDAYFLRTFKRLADEKAKLEAAPTSDGGNGCGKD